MNSAQQAIALLRNAMTGDDLRQLPDLDLHRLETVCQHWLAMAATERKARTNSGNSVLSGV